MLNPPCKIGQGLTSHILAESVSAVIPVYNRFEYLGECLESVFRQTRVPDEVLIVDDCSSTSITEYLERTGFLNRVNVLRTDRNRRVAGARNWGWKHARGNLVVFLDSDDLWESHKTEVQIRRFRENPEIAGTYGAMAAFFPDGSTQPWAHDRPSSVTVANALADCNICVQALMIRREVLEAVGGFDETFGILDDQDIAIRLALSKHRILFFPEPSLVRLRRHSLNYSSNAGKYFREDMIINRRYKTLFGEVYGPGSRRVHLARAVTRFGNHMKYMGAPSRLLAWMLGLSAPRSWMPRRGAPTV